MLACILTGSLDNTVLPMLSDGLLALLDGSQSANNFLHDAGREYLDNTVVPVLRDGLRMLVKERPEDPCTYLVDYIKAHHP